jgi:hypothetical protein
MAIQRTLRRRLVGLLSMLGLAIALGAAAQGCYVGPAPGHCPGGYWVEGHYGPRGRWHPGHWRCPGVVEIE